MARRLRMLGTNSKTGECPTLYEDIDTGEVLVQGKVAEPEDIAQMVNPLSGETMVVVDRALLINFSPKE
ncbi:hypothetical protein OG204_14215 [Streptomyces sp. NBC_01387]|uniref:hypothetical protein n=1 Tax=unclassified Streptomyces TaxID=2593676 RepID=UPI00225BEC7E|nr:MULTISPECIES: hypothetical protein [unclassified Streptomyces]MCX4550503.1 hypothetical protein [Streptomyces sp. NBC_01500]WSC21952.1 hypothetical protein OIE60_20955 [Streptomyces sp. NBC_01766]WSV55907.1 hypothetical protein OG282_20595 [Streptomyces sp. NBC_01014]